MLRNPLRMPTAHARHAVAIFGLNAVGRQVAGQLTALGVRQLMLIDPGHVSRNSALRGGYGAEDVGRPRVHATAQACHALQPKLDIRTVVGRNLPKGESADAVFCCTPARWARSAARRALSNEVGFFATADVHEERLYVAVLANAPKPRLADVELTPPWDRPPTRCPLHIASIAAGLMLVEFTRFVARGGEDRELYVNLETMTLTVAGLA